MIKCKGCRTYWPDNDVCAIGITDVDNCPCYICLVKGMCNYMCEKLDDAVLRESAKRLSDQIDKDIISEIIEDTRRDNG